MLSDASTKASIISILLFINVGSRLILTSKPDNCRIFRLCVIVRKVVLLVNINI